SSQNRNTGFHAIHLPCKYLKNAPQGAFRPKIYPQILLTSHNYYQNCRRKAAQKRLPLGQGSFFDLDVSHAQVTVFKKAEDGDGYILRLLETTGQEGVASFRSPIFPLAASYLTDGVEDNLSPLAVKKDGVQIPLRPREFTTVRLVFGAKAGVIPSARSSGEKQRSISMAR
ncbi:MAG: hypothetical protein KKE86_16255, partial [Planctomycetes bacterium]|nr:hypothetical protein [Planctomycetota bacterium]